MISYWLLSAKNQLFGGERDANSELSWIDSQAEKRKTLEILGRRKERANPLLELAEKIASEIH
jgi:hypothetical protein